MNDQLTQLLENYKDGVPVKVERTTFVWLAATAILTGPIVKVWGRLLAPAKRWIPDKPQ